MRPERLPWTVARCMESFTEARLRTKARTTQLAPNVLQRATIEAKAVRHSAGIGGTEGLWTSRRMLARITNASTRPAAKSPGIARFHGKGIGGGAAASRATASMTEAAKPRGGKDFLLLGQDAVEVSVSHRASFLTSGVSNRWASLARSISRPRDNRALRVPSGTSRLPAAAEMSISWK